MLFNLLRYFSCVPQDETIIAVRNVLFKFEFNTNKLQDYVSYLNSLYNKPNIRVQLIQQKCNLGSNSIDVEAIEIYDRVTNQKIGMILPDMKITHAENFGEIYGITIDVSLASVMTKTDSLLKR